MYYFAAGSTDEARFIYDQLTELGTKPDDSAVATLIVQYGQAKQLERAQELFDSASASASFPDGALVCNAMVDAFCKCGRAEDAYHLFMEMADQGSNRDAVTASILVTRLTKHGKRLSLYSAAACYIYSSFFSNGHGCSLPGKFQEVENIMHGCFRDEVQLDTALYNTFIKSMLESGLANILYCSSDRQAGLSYLTAAVLVSKQVNCIRPSAYTIAWYPLAFLSPCRRSIQ
jgi:pentatricopeptide repeat protein